MNEIFTKKIGFLGGGKMGEAIFSGLLSASIPKENIYVADVNDEKLQYLSSTYGVHTVNSLHNGMEELLENCSIVVLAVIPQIASTLLSDSRELFREDKHILVSIAGGVEVATLEELLPGMPIVRVMPNTPMLVKEGVAGLAPGKNVSKEQCDTVLSMFQLVGRALLLKENMIDPLTSISGCGPAYVYMFIEALADGGVALGLPRDMAVEVAAQTLIGASKMVLETGMHPGQLKDNVCSPGGGTIAGVHALEHSGFRGTVIKGVVAGLTRMVEVGKESK